MRFCAGRAALLCLASVLAALHPVAACAATPAALALVLAIDVSASVDAGTFVFERNGIARAFADRRLVETIAASPGGIEALVLEWSDPDAAAIAVDWRRIADAKTALRFAAAVGAARRRSAGRTAIGPALIAAAREFARLPAPAARRVIDISGNGMANLGMPPAAARDGIVAAGITINGLALATGEPWLAAYYRDNLIGGAGAFVVAARDEASFAEAMLRKLVLEVAGGGDGAEAAPDHRADATQRAILQMQ